MWPPIEIPQIQHLSNFIRKRVKAEFDPDFGDVYKSEVFKERKGKKSILIRGVPEKNPSVLSVRANTELKSVQLWPIVPLRRESNTQRTADCFSCLVRGHPTRECRSKNKCGKNGCTKMPHPIPPPPPPFRYQPRAEWSCICFWITEALCQWYA